MDMNDTRKDFFTETYTKYAVKMEKICLAYVNYDEEYRTLIDDSIQETFITAMEHYHEIEDHEALEGWFLTTCHHRFTTAVRKHRRRKGHHAFSLDDDDRAPQMADMANSVDEWWQRESNVEQIQRILDVLSERELEIFRERFEKERSIEEVSHTQNMTVSAVKSILSRIRRKARKLKEINFQVFVVVGATLLVLTRFYR